MRLHKVNSCMQNDRGSKSYIVTGCWGVQCNKVWKFDGGTCVSRGYHWKYWNVPHQSIFTTMKDFELVIDVLSNITLCSIKLDSEWSPNDSDKILLERDKWLIDDDCIEVITKQINGAIIDLFTIIDN